MKNYILILVICTLMLTGCSKYQKYNKTINTSNKKINVVIYTKNKNQTKKVFNDIKLIYNKYEKIEQQILENNNKNVEINNDIKDIINYGIAWNSKSKGYVNINTYGLYRIYNNNINYSVDKKSYNINNIKIKNNKINKNSNIDVSFYIDGYATNKVYEYLKKHGISKFFISYNSTALTGYTYDKDYYNVAIPDPFKDSILKVLKLKNQYITTKSIYDNYIEIDGNMYSTIINGKTLKPSAENVSVTVITKDPSIGDMLATTLFLMPYDEGIEYIKGYDAEAIWCFTKENKEFIKYTSGINYY